MTKRNALQLHASEERYTVVVEPWASEFIVQPGDVCEVVALHPHVQPSLQVELAKGKLIVTVNESSATFEFWRGKRRELEMHVPIPW
jgi:hypothetical protein